MFLSFVTIVIPSAPRDVKVAFVNQSAVEITWLPPAITGDQTHVFYDVDCRIRKICSSDDCLYEACGSDITYIPDNEDLKMTNVSVTGLSSFVNYTFKIHVKNRVSEVAKRKYGVEENFATLDTRTNGSGKLWSIWSIHDP